LTDQVVFFLSHPVFGRKKTSCNLCSGKLTGSVL